VDGMLYIADVGQNAWEEVDVVPATAAGVNFGWRVREGGHCYNASSCPTTGLTDPVLEYAHSPACSITGGFVYRGTRVPQLAGHYVYADYCAGWIRSFRFDGSVTNEKDWSLDAGNVQSFGRDAAGDLYVMNGAGSVMRIVGR
jgi:Glucose / Sorbosone dehydrogenase